MSKKNSNVILKNCFKNYEDLSHIYSSFKKKLSSTKKKLFLIAVSGGPDSLALSALAKAYSINNKCKIYYVLVDHNIRKKSLQEAQSVKKLLKKYGIKIDILRNKKKISNNIQSEARTIRYKLLIEFCKKKKINTILTAHHLEDQVETFFIRLSRGSGLQGLSSMKQSNKVNGKINLLRPLLEFKKYQLIKISKIIFGKYFIDPTNKDTKYLRTRIRNLKPSLETSGINYDKIFQSIKNLASSRDTLNNYLSKVYKDTIDRKGGKIFVNVKKFNNINLEMKILVLKKLIKDYTGSYYTVRSKKIVNLIRQIETKEDAKLTLGGCIIIKGKKHIIIQKENKNKRFY